MELRKKTDYLIIHCAATKPSMDIGVNEIRKWHLDRGWRDVGYHYMIRRNGEVELGRRNDDMGAHASGYNHNSIGVCLIGGMAEANSAENNFTENAMGISGTYNISKWVRPVRPAFKFKKGMNSINLKEGDHISYFKLLY